MRAPLLAATLVLAAPLTSCDHSPSPGRSADRAPCRRGTRSTPLQPRDEAAPCLRVQGRGGQRCRGAAAAPRSPRSGSTPPPTPPPARSSGPGRPASRSIRSSRRWICSGRPPPGSADSSANATVQSGRNQVRPATLEIKVPAGRFDDLTDGLQPLGRVEFVNVGAEDVSEEFVDLTARVANGAAAGGAAARAAGHPDRQAQDVLSVERELARVREEIERMEGRLRYLKTRSQLSTLSVAMHEPPPLVSSTRAAASWRRRSRRLAQLRGRARARVSRRWGTWCRSIVLGWGAVVAGRRLTRRPA